jgi:integrase
MVKHVLPRIGKMPLDEITTAVIQTVLNEEAEHGNLRDNGPLSAKSLKNMRVALDVCCKRAVAEGHMDSNPVPGTVLKRCPTKRVEVMTNENQAVLERYLMNYDRNSSLDAGTSLGLHTGMRLGEVCALKWGHYDPREGCLHIQETIRRVSNYEEDAAYGSRTALVTTRVKTDASDRTLYTQISVELKTMALRAGADVYLIEKNAATEVRKYLSRVKTTPCTFEEFLHRFG